MKPLVLFLVAAIAVPACSRKPPASPPVATPSVTFNHDRAPLGSPLEITYRFVVAPNATFDEDYRVMAHVVDTDEEMIWNDDHSGYRQELHEQILGSELRTKSYATGKWLGFNPDFVYRHRPVKPSVSTAKLAEALAAMTRRVDDFADRIGYDVT